ncbi:MAG: GTPase ObgE [Candidatus Sumerlaea chitinivorans]|nr:GTPase ObgE [Candidatus Sumerlaea chitinivorans]
MFVDYAKIYLEAGDGGTGCVSFRREKYVPHGGPDGGDGGRGGHIYLVADPHVVTLLDFKYRPHYRAKRGQHGMGSNCSGRDAEDLYLHVPLGTVVSDEHGNHLADLVEPGQVFLAARGGRGGRGNQHFATPTNKAPRKFEYGEKGERRTLILELKLIADVGIIGLPNAGKSTLLATLTAATPKIAPYPFTTIHPNLGVMEFDDATRCTLADIPGLIEGAHRGTGLGHRFLRHIERTKLLVHLIAPPEQPPLDDFEAYRYARELVNRELAQYSATLAAKPQIVCLSKCDLLEPTTVEALVRQFREREGVEILPISAQAHTGLERLKSEIQKALRNLTDSESMPSVAVPASSLPASSSTTDDAEQLAGSETGEPTDETCNTDAN